MLCCRRSFLTPTDSWFFGDCAKQKPRGRARGLGSPGRHQYTASGTPASSGDGPPPAQSGPPGT